MENAIVGIDVSKDQLDVAVVPSKEAFCVPRNSEGLDELVRRLLALSPKLVVMEATGGFETIVAAALAAAALPVAVVNPQRIRAFAKAMGRLAKTLSMLKRLPSTAKRPNSKPRKCRMKRRACLASSLPAGAKSSRR